MMLPFKPIPAVSTLFRQVIIDKISEETAEAKTFVIRPTEGKIHYKAGQFLTFAFQSQRIVERRSYSMSSSSEMDEPLAVTIKRVANGAFSRPLLEWAKPGDQLTVAGKASGFFVLPQNMEGYDHVVFLAAGSGITPIFSLIKSLLSRHPRISVLLVYSNRSPEKAIFRKALLNLANTHPRQLRIEWLFSIHQDLWKARLNKLVLKRFLNQYLSTSGERTLVYLCGPFDYMRMASIVLQSHGIPTENIRREVFTPEVPASTYEPPDILPHQVTIKIDEQIYRLTVQYPNSILATARQQGIELPFSCEAGRCGSCVANCVRGKVWMKFNEVLTDQEVADGRVLICNAFPVGGEVAIEFDS